MVTKSFMFFGFSWIILYIFYYSCTIKRICRIMISHTPLSSVTAAHKPHPLEVGKFKSSESDHSQLSVNGLQGADKVPHHLFTTLQSSYSPLYLIGENTYSRLSLSPTMGLMLKP